MTDSYKVRFFYIANAKTRECAFTEPVAIAGPEAEDIDPKSITDETVRADILDGNGKLVRKVFCMGAPQSPEEISHMGGNAAYAVYVPELNRIFPAGKDDRIKEGKSYKSVSTEKSDGDNDNSELNDDFEDAVKPEAAKPEFKPRPQDYVEPGLQEIPSKPEPEKPYIPVPRDIPRKTPRIDRKLH